MTSPALPPDLESVSVCVPDHYGRLAGKRIAAHRFGEILAGGLDMPDFHLVTGPDNQPAAGVAATGDHTGFPNDVLWPDMETFRRLPWDPDTGIVLAQARRRDGSVIAEAPRAILQHQAERLASHGLSAWVATELEFYVYEDSYAQSFRKGYRSLSPLYHRNGDNDVLVTEFLDGYLRPLRRAMADVGLPAEATQGEGGVGQVEMNFPADAPLRAADAHALFKHAAKAIAYRHDRCVTFMAQPDQDQAASGCHLHLSLRDQAGLPCTAAPGTAAPGSPAPGSRAQRTGPAVPGRPARVLARAHAAPRAGRELLPQAAARWLGAGRGHLGARRPAGHGAGGRQRPLAAAGVPAARGGRQPVPGHRGGTGGRHRRPGDRGRAARGPADGGRGRPRR